MPKTHLDDRILLLLLRKLGEDLDHRDGDAAVKTIEMIELVKGQAYATALVDRLITASLRALTTQK